MSHQSDYCRRYEIEALPRGSWYRANGKRCLDLAVCVPILILASPVLLLAAALIKFDSQGPVLFVQERLGRFGRTFRTYKFRTMTHRVRTAHAEVLPGHSEVTRVGHWLRRFKIDELPQILNVVNGDMSLVGPRPALPEAIREYNADGLRRLLERPGLTGLAQVNGNIYLSWPERWAYDAEYVNRLSLGLDLQILLKTAAVVALGEEKFLRQPDSSSSAALGTQDSSRRAA